MFSNRPSARFALQGPPRLRIGRRAKRRLQARAAQPAPAPRSYPRIRAMRVVAHAHGWALKVDDIDEPAWVVSTKKSAVSSAKDCATFHGAALQVFTQSGRVHKTFDYGLAEAS